MSNPEGIPQEFIDAMCLTWRHDFGLEEVTEFAGMTPGDKIGLRLRMRQIYQHHVLPAIMATKAEERQWCLEAAEDNRYRFEPHDYEARGWNNACGAIAVAIRKRGEG